MKNDGFDEIGAKLKTTKKAVLYPHRGMDGDALGSCTALCLALRKTGVEALVLLGEEIPANLRILGSEYCTQDFSYAENADVSLCIDCSEPQRLGDRKDVFVEAPFTICIDHHGTGKPFCDMNHIDPEAAATAELIYKLIIAMGIEFDAEIGDRIIGGIMTDTGDFRYSNTTAETHLIAANLFRYGIKPAEISIEINENDRPEKIKLEGMVLSELKLLHGGKIAAAFATSEMFEKTGARRDETGGIVPKLRSIAGVETALFFREEKSGEIKVSMRSKRYVDVSEITQHFGGGGHSRAAGCTLYTGMEEAFNEVTEYVAKYMKDKYEKRNN